MSLVRTLDRMPKPLMAACSLALIAALAVLDYATGSRAWIEAFYLAPIALSAWYVGRWTGLLTACVAAGGAVAADILPNFHSSPLAVSLVNGAALLAMYLIFAVLLSDLRQAQEDLEAKARQRAEALLEEMEQHRHTQRSLRSSEERLGLLIESVRDYAILMLDTDGNIVTWNQGAQRLLGYSAEEIVARHFECLYPPEEAARGKPAEAMATAAEKGTWQDEGARLRKDGTQIWVATVLTALWDEEDELQGYSKVIHDLTARRRLEHELLNAEERQQWRIGQDLHDALGQDLTGIAFLCKELEDALAARGVAESSEAARIVRYANQATLRARALARGLCPVDLAAEGLMGALKQLAEGLAEVFAVACEFQCPQPVLVHDEDAALHLYRIAQEATSNAVKHGQPRQVTIRLGAAGERVVLEVLDDGKGIDPAAAGRSGMGIALMNYRARAIGGALTVAPRPEGGTIVTCWAPRSGQPG
jgi:PAS domain S-box-containing protein